MDAAYYGEVLDDEDQGIHYAQSPDLISALLDFDASELDGPGELAEDVLVTKLAAIKGWSIKGKHPRYLLRNWVEVVITGRMQGLCRIINARTHTNLVPFTLEHLIREVDSFCAWVDAYQSAPDFKQRLLTAYDELTEDYGDVSLHALFKVINQHLPGYRREAFGIDLSRALSDMPVVNNRRVVLSKALGQAAIERYWISPAQGRAPKAYHLIQIGPDMVSGMQSLNI